MPIVAQWKGKKMTSKDPLVVKVNVSHWIAQNRAEQMSLSRRGNTSTRLKLTVHKSVLESMRAGDSLLCPIAMYKQLTQVSPSS